MLYILPMSILTHLMIRPNQKIEIILQIRAFLESSIICITDDEPPHLKLKELTILKNESYAISDFIDTCYDNSKKDCTFFYQEQAMESYKEVGSYKISITAQDALKNQITKETKLTIIEKSSLLGNHIMIENNQQGVEEKESKQTEIKRNEFYLNEQENQKITEVLQYVNEERKKVGLHPLVLSNSLNIAATIRSQEMAKHNLLSHTRPNGTECFSVFEEVGIPATSMGENIAYGYQTSAGVFQAWKNSLTHYANIIKSNYQYIGIGIANKDGTYYWTQLFSNIE